MHRFLIPVALLAACDGGTTGSVDTDTGTPPEVRPGVMRHCPTVVGNICPYAGAGYNGYNRDNVHRLDAWFSFPMSIVWPTTGERPLLFDWNNHKIRAVNENPEDGFETVMGTEFLGDGDPLALDKTPEGADGDTVALNHPTMGVFYSDGTLLAATWHTHKFRTWDPTTGKVHVVLGSAGGWVPPDQDALEATVKMNQPKELVIDPTDENIVYYLDMRNERIRKWDDAAGLVDTIAGSGSKGVVGVDTGCETPTDDPLTPCVVCPPDPQPAIADVANGILGTCFNFPKNGNPEPGGALAISTDGSLLYVADSESHAIRVLDIAAGTISTLAGTPGTHGYADGPADQALFHYPVDFALDDATNTLFVADANNHVIRAIDLATNEVTTVVGTGSPTCPLSSFTTAVVCDEQQTAGDGFPATAATLYRPFGVDLDPDGNLVVADTYDHRLRTVYR